MSAKWWKGKNARDITAHIHGVLRAKHSAPEWISTEEIQFEDQEMSKSWSRRLDFLAIGVWSNTGRRRVIYEVKASRADFKNELKNPVKRKTAERLGTDCYFAMPHGLVTPDEIPEGWGLLEVMNGGKSRVKKNALQREVEWTWNDSMKLFMRLKRQNPSPLEEASENGAKWNMKPIFRHAGNEFTEEELVVLAKLIFRDQWAQRERDEEKVVVDRWKSFSPEWSRMEDIEYIVKALFDLPDDFTPRVLKRSVRGIAVEKTGLSEENMNKVRRCVDKLKATARFLEVELTRGGS